MSCLWPKEHDRECAMTSSCSLTQNQTGTARMATRQHLTSQANQAGVCFVLNECSDDPENPQMLVGQNVPLPTEATEQIPLSPTAPPPSTSRKRPLSTIAPWDDNDEPWTEADRRTGWNNVVFCMELVCAIIRNRLYQWPDQRASPQTCVSFSLGHKDTVALT